MKTYVWIVVVGLLAVVVVGGCGSSSGVVGGGGAVVPLRVMPGQVVNAIWSRGVAHVVPQTLIAQGGAPGVNAYTWTEPTGSTNRIPFGCAVAALTGVFQPSGGQLVGVGNYPFEIQVSDGTSTAAAMVTLQVEEFDIAPIPVFQQFLGIGTWRLPDATANRPYGHSLAVLGGEPPYTWTEDVTYAGRANFALSGLLIDQARGIVRGTVNNSAAGQTLRFRVVVRDNNGDTAVTDDLTYEIVVN